MRLARSGAPVRQITTAAECRLDAEMIAKALTGWEGRRFDALFIENVGNLICPAEYDLGEDLRVVFFAVTEGEDKPLKYPLAFNTLARRAGHQDRHRRRRRLRPRPPRERASRQVNPDVPILELSARTGAGMDAWIALLENAFGLKHSSRREKRFPSAIPANDAAADATLSAPVRVRARLVRLVAPARLRQVLVRRVSLRAGSIVMPSAIAWGSAGSSILPAARCRHWRRSRNRAERRSFERACICTPFEADAAAWSRALLDAWKARQEHALLILEHAEAIIENRAVLALLGDLLAARPAERVILISSRTALPLRFAHYFAPHQILTLTRSELRFDDDEARGVFEGTELGARRRRAHRALADGWPIVLLLLALFAQYDANVERLLDRLGASSTQHSLRVPGQRGAVGVYARHDVRRLLAAAAIPNASLEDIAAATGIRHATGIVDRLLRLPGFISSESGVYQAHPLLLVHACARAADTNSRSACCGPRGNTSALAICCAPPSSTDIGATPRALRPRSIGLPGAI